MNGDQAVTANLVPPAYSPGDTIGKLLFVLHGTDVFALSISSTQGLNQLTIPRAAQLTAKLIARTEALSPAPSGSPSQ